MKQCTESTKRARKKLGWRPAETKNFPRKTGILSQCQGRKLTDIQPKYSTIPIPTLSQVGRKLPKTNKSWSFQRNVDLHSTTIRHVYSENTIRVIVENKYKALNDIRACYAQASKKNIILMEKFANLTNKKKNLSLSHQAQYVEPTQSLRGQTRECKGWDLRAKTQRNNVSLAATNEDQESIQNPLSLWLVMQWAVLMNGFIAQKILKVDITIKLLVNLLQITFVSWLRTTKSTTQHIQWK